MSKKVWFITGCSRGFGKTLVEELLQSTDSLVFATARNIDSLLELKESYQERLNIFELDVTDSEQVAQAVGAAITIFGRIDVLVNNAGYGLGGAIEECSMQEIRDIFETNVFGLIAVTKSVLPYMRKQESGYIINISSVAGLVSLGGFGAYNATKFAVEGLSEALAQELSGFGIKVTIIEPGPFRTDFHGSSAKLAKTNPDYGKSTASGIRGYLESNDGKQAGDPIKAAQIMIGFSNMENPPLRMPLGQVALDRIAVKFDKMLREFTELEALAKSADY